VCGAASRAAQQHAVPAGGQAEAGLREGVAAEERLQVEDLEVAAPLLQLPAGPGKRGRARRRGVGYTVGGCEGRGPSSGARARDERRRARGGQERGSTAPRCAHHPACGRQGATVHGCTAGRHSRAATDQPPEPKPYKSVSPVPVPPFYTPDGHHVVRGVVLLAGDGLHTAGITQALLQAGAGGGRGGRQGGQATVRRGRLLGHRAASFAAAAARRVRQRRSCTDGIKGRRSRLCSSHATPPTLKTPQPPPAA
jgi:hypothetical protein